MPNDQPEELRAAMDRVRGAKAGPVASDDASARDGAPREQPRSLRSRFAEGFARVEEPGAAVWPWPVAGLLAGVWAAAMSLLSVAFVVLAAWIFAPLGSGQFGDVMRTSAAVWLLADGGLLRWQGAVLSLPPLLLTMGLMLFQRRAGRWLAAATAAESVRAALPALGFAIAAAVSAQVLVANAIAGLGLVAPIARNAAGAAVVALLGFSWGVEREVVPAWPPQWVLVARALRVFVQALFVPAVAVLLVLLVARRAAFLDVLQAVAGDVTSRIELVGVCLAYLPTVLLWLVALMAGPGFSLGTGTYVGLSSLTVGALPPVPLLALLPGQMPAAAPVLTAFAALAACTAAWRVRADRHVGIRVALVLGAALLGALMGAAASGGMGPSRLAQVGVVWWQTALALGAWMLGALLAAEALHRARARVRLPQSGAVDVEPAESAE